MPVFYGALTYTSEVETEDTVLRYSLTAFSPDKIILYFGQNKFRMVEYGGMSHGDVIIYPDKKEAWQLDTVKKIAYLGEYSDLGDPSSELKDIMPDHFAPTVEATGKTENILGYSCKQYHIVRSGFIPSGTDAFIWATDAFMLPPARYDISTDVNSSVAPPPVLIGYDKGAVLKMEIDGENYKKFYTATAIDKDPVQDSVFIIPSDYQKK